LIASLILAVLLSSHISPQTTHIFYSISCFIKDILLFVLPFVIISYMCASLMSFEKQGPILIVLFITMIICSNALVVFSSFGLSNLLIPHIDLETIHNVAIKNNDHPLLFSFPLKPFIRSEIALFLGIVLGVSLNIFLKPYKHIAFKARTLSTDFLKHVFIPFLPLYIFGFVLKMEQDGALNLVVQKYSQVFLIICVCLIFYLFLMYFIGSGFNIRKTFSSIKEMLPAGITGFSTMSSAATMPITLDATEKNINNKMYADFAIPAGTNIHLIGDGMSIPLSTIALIVMTGGKIPTFMEFIPFVFFYCLAKFSCAAVPGAGIIVILPVVQKCFDLSPEAMGLLTTLYILQDPILTASNVMGNGAFSMITYRLLKRFTR
jgi:Na+/H+-dicarboxylate symporter